MERNHNRRLLSLDEELRRARNRSFGELDAGFLESLAFKVTPTFQQTDFRWRNDDGSESGATWLAAANTDPTSGDIALDTNFRIRFAVGENTGNSGTLVPQLQYKVNSGSWTDVNGSSSNVRSSASPNETDDVATTQQLGSTLWSASSFDEVDGRAASVSLALSNSDVEFCCQFRSADLATSDVVQLRVVDTSTALNSYLQTPSYTIPAGGGPSALPWLYRSHTQTLGAGFQRGAL